MRMALYIWSALMVVGLAFWAYRENYATQHALRQLTRVQDQIATLRGDIAMQKAEWAYENRPSRLRELAVVNFDKLQLLPMEPWQLGDANQVPLRAPSVATPAAPSAADGKIALGTVQPQQGATQ